jgi:hypothetical protein
MKLLHTLCSFFLTDRIERKSTIYRESNVSVQSTIIREISPESTHLPMEMEHGVATIIRHCQTYKHMKSSQFSWNLMHLCIIALRRFHACILKSGDMYIPPVSEAIFCMSASFSQSFQTILLMKHCPFVNSLGTAGKRDTDVE